VQRSSYDECCRALSALGTREGRREVYRKITERAGYDLLPAAGWLLLRIRRYGSVEPGMLAERSAVPLQALMAAARQVEERRLAERRGLDLVLTDSGREVAERLAAAREESLAAMLGDWWRPGRSEDLSRLVHDLTGELCGAERERPHNGTRLTKVS
jgi:DNA-binding MarR family transcriptional regulator